MKKKIIIIVILYFLFSVTVQSCKSNIDKPVSKQKDSTITKDSIASQSKDSKKSDSTTMHEVKLKDDEIKNLNTFLSNFSEIFMEPFQKDNITDKQLISFGVLHLYRNNLKLFEKADKSTVKINETQVDKSVLKYLGRRINKHQSADGILYKNGYYFLPEADGEALVFSQVDKIYDVGENDYFLVYLNVYSAFSGWSGDVNGKPDAWKDDGEGKPELSDKMKATIQVKNDSEGKTAYTLIDYLKK